MLVSSIPLYHVLLVLQVILGFQGFSDVCFNASLRISDEDALEMITDTPKQGRRRKRGGGAKVRLSNLEFSMCNGAAKPAVAA